MSAEQMTSLMQRKTRTGREAHAARAMSLGRALRLTAAKQADRLMGLALGTLSVTQKTCDGDALTTHLLPDSLMLLLDGPDGQVGAAMLEPVLVAGLIQQQTMGEVKAAAEQTALRPATATDAALCAPFVEALMARAALLPEAPSDRNLLKGYRFGVWASLPRQLLLALEANSFEVIEMTLDLAAGTRVGKLVMLLPEPVAVPQEVASDDADEAPTPRAVSTLDQHVMELHADLTIALTRLKMPIQEVTQMKVGDILDINVSSMEQALVIDTSGRALTRGTLGQIEGMRALQVEQQKAGQHREPRRRISDRDDLDLPDVTGGLTGGNRATDVEGFGDGAMDAMNFDDGVDIPSMSEVDIFGDIGDLPEMPVMSDMDDLVAEADARMDGQLSAEEEAAELKASQAGW